MFVVLNMEIEDVKERLRTRHKGEEGMVKMLTVMFLCPIIHLINISFLKHYGPFIL